MPRFRLVQLAVGFPDILFCILQSTGNSFLFRSLICRVMPLYAYLSKNSCKQSTQFRETFFERFPLISFFRPSFFPGVPIQSPSIHRAPCNSTRPWKFRFFSPSLRCSTRLRVLRIIFTGVRSRSCRTLPSILNRVQRFNYRIEIILNGHLLVIDRS